jgi:hypothetical protein
MATRKQLAKDAKICAEIARLTEIFADMDENKKEAVKSVINNVAFMAVSLEELQNMINAKGYTEKYKNGENQYGVKQSETVKTHISMTRNFMASIKLLVDLVPPDKQGEDALEALVKELVT